MFLTEVQQEKQRLWSVCSYKCLLSKLFSDINHGQSQRKGSELERGEEHPEIPETQRETNTAVRRKGRTA